jgi:hypothetical protein
MFIGSIDKPARIMCDNLLQKTVGRLSEVYVGCSGNFTFDRIASARGFRVHSNDVSLYSRVIAGIVTDKRFRFKCKNPMLETVFAEWPDTPQADLVKIMFAMRVGKFAEMKNEFQRTMMENYLSGAKEFCQGTLDKFEHNAVFDFKIADFFYGDFKEHISQADPANTAVFLYAPTYKGGYEKLFNFIDESFEYEMPNYELFESKEAGPYYEQILKKYEACIYSDILYPETTDYLKGEATYTGNKKTVYLYSSIKGCEDCFYITEPAKILDRTPKPISPEMELPENPKIKIVPCKVAVVNHYKHLYMSSKVDYSTGGDFALAFLMNGNVFGFASFASGLRTIKSSEYLFLHSDFVVPSKIDRLSKLLLYLLRSKESYTHLMRYYVHAYTGLQTSVYTDRPVSMKYRGPFKKIERDGDPKNKLTYVAEFTQFSVKECFERWQQRKSLN